LEVSRNLRSSLPLLCSNTPRSNTARSNTPRAVIRRLQPWPRWSALLGGSRVIVVPDSRRNAFRRWERPTAPLRSISLPLRSFALIKRFPPSSGFSHRTNARSDFFNLSILQFHRRRTAEDRDGDLDPRTVLVDILHDPVE